MKRGAVLINVARGEIVDTDALVPSTALPIQLIAFAELTVILNLTLLHLSPLQNRMFMMSILRRVCCCCILWHGVDSCT